MNTILKFYIEVLVAGIFCAIFGLISLLRLDFIRPDGAIFISLPLLLPLVIIAFRDGLRGSVICALLGGVLLYVTKSGSSFHLAEFIEMVLAPLLASLIGLFKTYSRPTYQRILAAASLGEIARLIAMSFGACFYSGEFRADSLVPALVDNFYYLIVDFGLLIGILTFLYFLTKGSLFEYKI